MSLVTLAQLRFLARNSGSMLSALLGMTIGVASVVGVHLLSAQVASSVAEQERPVGDVDLYLMQTTLSENDYFALRARWRAGELPEVDAIFPLLEGEVRLGDETYFLVGTDPLASLAFEFTDDLRGGEAGAGDTTPSVTSQIARFLSTDSVYLPARSAEQSQKGAADRVALSGYEVEVLGYTMPAQFILADLPTARAVLIQPDEATPDEPRLSRIGVRLKKASRSVGAGTRVLELARNFFPGVFAEPAIEPLAALGKEWQQVSAADQNPAQQLFRSVLFNVAALSVLALVVAWLLTYQVACHALGRRQQMFERLLSLGVSRRRLRTLTQLEGLLLGVVATLAGVAAGLMLANVLLSLAVGEGFEFALGLSTFVWIKALVSGIGVAGFSYWLAAGQTLLGEPRAVAQAHSVIHSGLAVSGFARYWGGLIALVLAVVFFWGLWGTSLVGAFGCIVVSALVLIIYLPALVRWLWRRTLAPVKELLTSKRKQSSTLKLLGVRQVLVGQELRLGVSALALALATALGISIMVDSFRVAFLQMLDQRLADDVVVRVQSDAPSDIRTILEAEVSPVVDGMYWRGTRDVSIGGVAGRIEFADDTKELLDRFLPTQSVREPGQSVYLNESFARSQELAVGATVAVTGPRGSAVALVAGIFTDFGEVRPRLLASRDLALRLHHRAPLDQLYLRTQEGVSIRERIDHLLAPSWVTLQDQAQVRGRSIEIFEQTFAITRALTWLALLVAAVALANALLAHGLQQQGTNYRLQVLGVSADGQRRLRRARAFYVTGAAIVLAIPLGLLIAWLLCSLVNPRAFGWSFPLQLGFAGVGWPLIGGALGGLLAVALGDALVRRQAVHAMARTWLAPFAALILMLYLQGCNTETNVAASAATSTSEASSPGLRVGNLLGGEADGFARATRVVPFVFPRDHGAHPQFRSEWWYLTCPLREVSDNTDTLNTARAAEYGVQFTLFRQALLPKIARVASEKWRTGQVYMAHAALTDVRNERHLEDSRLVRGHPALAGVTAGTDEEPFSLWLEDWRLKASGEGSGEGSVTNLAPALVAGFDELALRVSSTEFAIALELVVEKPVVLQGDRGLSYKGSREASYYYSIPRLRARGVVQAQPAQAESSGVSVSGACWLDREWSTSVLANNLVGWDWFALQFNEGDEMMLFQLREGADSAEQLNPSKRQGKQITPDGTAITLADQELKFDPVRYWQDEAGVRWPVEWRIETPDRALRVVAALSDQKMRSSIEYWEGLVWIYEDGRRVGQGYLEMTGYGQEIQVAQGAGHND